MFIPYKHPKLFLPSYSRSGVLLPCGSLDSHHHLSLQPAIKECHRVSPGLAAWCHPGGTVGPWHYRIHLSPSEFLLCSVPLSLFQFSPGRLVELHAGNKRCLTFRNRSSGKKCHWCQWTCLAVTLDGNHIEPARSLLLVPNFPVQTQFLMLKWNLVQASFSHSISWNVLLQFSIEWKKIIHFNIIALHQPHAINYTYL